MQPPLFERGVQRVHQLFELERFGDEVGGAALDHVHGVTHGAVAGDDDGDDVGIALDSRVDHLDAVNAGQTQVGDEDVEGELRQGLDRPFARLGLHDDEAVIPRRSATAWRSGASSSTRSKWVVLSGI